MGIVQSLKRLKMAKANSLPVNNQKKKCKKENHEFCNLHMSNNRKCMEFLISMMHVKIDQWD